MAHYAVDDDLDLAGLSCDELQELWLGPSHNGSLFRSRTELHDAWVRGRDVAMELWARRGLRPQGWWMFEAPALGLKYPGDECERSYLFEQGGGVLSEAERVELLSFWRHEFERAYAPDFFTHRGSEVLDGAKARRKHFRDIDFPASLRREWTAERRRQARTIKKLATETLPKEEAPGATQEEKVIALGATVNSS
jgi:hypothetical protein